MTPFVESDHPRGRGGKFTEKHHAESTVRLGADAPQRQCSPSAPAAFTSPAFTFLASEHHQLTQAKLIANQVRERHPQATAIRPDYHADHEGLRSGSMEWRGADGSGGDVEVGEGEDFYPQDIAMSAVSLEGITRSDGWVELQDIDYRHEDTGLEYAAAVLEAVDSTRRAEVADRYAQDLAREMSIRHRMITAAQEGELNGDDEPYSRQDAEGYVDDFPEDAEDLASQLRGYVNDQTGELDGGGTRIMAAALGNGRGQLDSWERALRQATATVPFQDGRPGTLYAAPGVEVTTYRGRADGVPVIQVDTSENPNRVRVNVNDGYVFDGRTD